MMTQLDLHIYLIRSEKDFVLNESKDPVGRFSVGIPPVSDHHYYSFKV